ncbi:hypothetical protein D6C89_03526 [Aureobasidium pullulans]|nr:hypothetical protein D6C89_03526 [Aureobasidium pullulans]
MDLISPIGAAIAIAAQAVGAGFALNALCKGCSTAEKEVEDAAQMLAAYEMCLVQSEKLWAHELKQYQAGSTYLEIWGEETWKLVESNGSSIEAHFKNVQDRLESCISLEKTSKTKPSSTRGTRRRVSLFRRLILRVYGVKINKRSRSPASFPTQPQKRTGWTRKIKWCTSVRNEVADLLARISALEQLINKIVCNAFNLYRSRGKGQTSRVPVDRLTVSSALRRSLSALKKDPRNLHVEGHALIRERQKLQDATYSYYDVGAPPHARIRLPFVAVYYGCFGPVSRVVLCAEVSVDTDQTGASKDGLKVVISTLRNAEILNGDRQSLVNIISSDPDVESYKALRRRVQLALTICISVFDLYESDCLPVNLSVANIYSYQHELLHWPERSKIMFQKQMYVQARNGFDEDLMSTPFDHLHKGTSHPEDLLLHRIGIILFEIGYGSEYQELLPSLGSGQAHVDEIDDIINDMVICNQYNQLVRRCLSGTLGVNVVETARSSYARNVIKELETIEALLEDMDEPPRAAPDGDTYFYD